MLGKRFTRETESKWQQHWLQNETYAFRDDGKPIYSIDTPPPFTSGKFHMGHTLSYAYFDFVARYKRMTGHSVFYPQGWDTQGFPTEVRVEKKHGRLPPPAFREKCKEWTEEMIKLMKESMVQLGFSPDWNYQYRTMDPEYHRKVQYSLLQMFGKGMVYRGKHPVFWCFKCGSALAKTDTEDLERESILNYVIFTGPEGEPLEIATTRPELMPACVAVMFHPEDERYKHLAGKLVKTALGKEVPVLPDRDVLKDFGTGLLMVCTFGDKQDVVWVYRHNLPVIEMFDGRGKLKNAAGLDGMTAEEARRQIIEVLKKEGKLVKQEKLVQTVKIHDRCKSSVEFQQSYQWFANITQHKEGIKKMAREVEWVPSFGISYLDDWVNSVEWDWVISRQRIFGTPIPFYYCEKCPEVAPAEESELPFYPEKAKEKACKCGGKMVPETSVLDCWVDSSITPLAIADWPDGPKVGKLYPSSLRPQGVEIIRTWAFYTIYRSGVALTGKAPWKTILLNGNVLAPDGKKMSKSLGNVIQPDELLREYQADALRQWAAMSGAMAKDRPFSYEDIKFAKSFLNKLWNASRFVQGALEGYGGSEPAGLGMLDRWMLERLNQLIEKGTEAMGRSEFHHHIRALQDFFWHDFCDDYLEYVKHRIYGEDAEAKKAAQYVLHKVLYEFVKLLAPIAPHITEELYHEMFEGAEGESVHFAKWPEPGERYAGEFAAVEAGFREIVRQVRQHKASERMAQSAELEKVSISTHEPLPEELLGELKKISKIKEIETEKGELKASF